MALQNKSINSITNFKLYEGCGNKLLIVEMEKVVKSNLKLRKTLRSLGLKYKADSVIVVTGNPTEILHQGFHVSLDVFEPRGEDSENPELVGSWSAMCGNGVRAVVRYLIDQEKFQCLIRTGSGILPVTVLPKNNYRVSMGQFTDNQSDLKKYVTEFNFRELIPNGIRPKAVFVGLNGNLTEKGEIDGEPHFVAILKRENINLEKLMAICMRLGPKITRNRSHFPKEINTNIASYVRNTSDKLVINACTFERGVEYVTQACGTGATVIGSWLLKQNSSLKEVQINMPGGKLKVTKNDNNYYLTGPASPIT